MLVFLIPLDSSLLVVNPAPKLNCDGTLVINRRELSRPEPEERLEDIDEGLGDLEVGSGKGLDPTPVAAQLPAGLHLALESADGLEKPITG